MNPKVWLSLACLLGLAAWTGCTSDDDDGGGDASDAAAGAALTLVTFNAGLLDSVGYVEQRKPFVEDAVTALDADVVCMQEMWDADHWDDLVAANADARPYAQRLEAMPGVQGLCTLEEFAPLRECAEDNCSDPGPEGLVSCTTSSCTAEVTALSSDCVTCLIDNAEAGGFDAIEATCVGASDAASGDEGITPPEDRSYFLGGSFGIGLLSRLEPIEQDSLVLDSSTNRRGVLYAKVDAPELGEVALFCTHLTPDLPGLAYDGSFGSWAGENAAHVDALLEWIDEKTRDGEPVIILGDLNTGPDGDAFEPELPESYAELPAAGFESPYLDGADPRCTFCGDNPLVLSADTGVDAVIDHVLLRDVDGSASASRILDDEIMLEGDEDAGAEAETLARSDHYGVEVQLAP
jgi:endonuclease/exonuclease/phosphatase family metal-dependent hydrolase